MLKKALKLFRLFIPALLVITAIFGTIEVVVQQNYRQLANDPQIQMAQDQAKALENGQKIESINAGSKIDLTQSLGTFLIIYDTQGSPVASTAILNGRIPVPPVGVFKTVDTNGEDRVTWQPSGDVRIAAVVTAFHGQTSGYVLAGRSLKEVEKRESQLNMQVGAGYLATLVVILASLWLLF